MARICRDVDCVVEIFGRCRGEYCAQERLGLIERARREARGRGHAVSSFEKAENRAIWRAQCQQCGLTVAITLSAGVDERSVYGEALDQECPAAEGTPRDV